MNSNKDFSNLRMKIKHSKLNLMQRNLHINKTRNWLKCCVKTWNNTSNLIHQFADNAKCMKSKLKNSKAQTNSKKKEFHNLSKNYLAKKLQTNCISSARLLVTWLKWTQTHLHPKIIKRGSVMDSHFQLCKAIRMETT